MDVIQQIIRESFIGSSTRWFRITVLALFTLIVLMLLGMLSGLIIYGQHTTFSYGY